MKLVEVFGVRIEMPGNQPIVLLRELEGTRYLPIWVGSAEASAISFAHQGIESSRPLTHDLMVNLLEQLKHPVEQILISDLRDGVFYAELVLVGGARVSSRPSDAIALALKTKAPIFCADGVLNEAGIEIEDDQSPEDQVKEFREFLDNISPKDFS